MFVISLKTLRKIGIPLLILLVLLISIAIGYRKENVRETFQPLLLNGVIVVDAGHGEPDGGAVSKDGVKEATLNLQIALKLRDALEEEGFEVIMTREDENNIAPLDKQNTVREMKVADIDKRIEIVNQSEADVLISIHMNQFSASQYHGWQTFYQKNSEESKRLAECIQSEITQSIRKRKQ